VGDCDTALVPLIPHIQKAIPNAKWVIVWRNCCSVEKSCRGVGLPSSGIEWINGRLKSTTETLNALHIDFEDLFTVSAMTEIWAYLGLPEPFPYARFELLKEMQINDGLMPDHRFKNVEAMHQHTVNSRLLRESL